nr:A24 family peptidase [Tepidanaerobacter acetatoxydans]
MSAVTLISGLIISAFTDLEYQIIPDKIVLTTAVIGLLLNILIHGKDVLNYLMGSVLGGGTIFLIAALSQGGMGGGDIKLFAAVGLFLGMRLTLLSLLLSFILGATAGIILIVLKLKGIKDAIPFGPFIALGSIASLFAGDKIISWYFLKYVHI